MNKFSNPPMPSVLRPLLVFDPISLAYIKGKNKNRDQYNKEFNVKSEYSRKCQLDRQPAVIKNTEENRNKLKDLMKNMDDDDKPKSYLEINNNLYFCPRFWCGETQEPISLTVDSDIQYLIRNE